MASIIDIDSIAVEAAGGILAAAVRAIILRTLRAVASGCDYLADLLDPKKEKALNVVRCLKLDVLVAMDPFQRFGSLHLVPFAEIIAPV